MSDLTTREIKKRRGPNTYGICRGKAVIGECNCKDEAEFIAWYCNTYHAASFEAPYRHAAEKAWKKLQR